jgi:hypothetical protein
MAKKVRKLQNVKHSRKNLAKNFLKISKRSHKKFVYTIKSTSKINEKVTRPA